MTQLSVAVRVPRKPVFLQSYVPPTISHGSPELPKVQIPKDSVLSNPKFVLNFAELGTLNYISSKSLSTKLPEWKTQYLSSEA